MKSVYLRNKEDKRRGVDYVMNKILWFYKECLELRPEYLTGHEDERGVIFDEKKPFDKKNREVLLVNFRRTLLG
ncbi:hypothetical protein Tco_0373612 [Tanacetum coccineum]